jgi:hypothetical protein
VQGDTTSPIEAGSAPLSDADRAHQSEELAALRKQAPTERLPDHFLRTPRQIAERYGVPDSTFCSTEGELNFVYQRNESEPQLVFTFAGGVLVRLMGE